MPGFAHVGVHEELLRLVERAGPGVLEDGDTFRAALDDFLSESSASRGELNLLVDAVRLGSFARLLEQVGQGAAIDQVIVVLGASLARDRGTIESASAAWALGALAFAVGRLDESHVVELRAAMTPPAPAESSAELSAAPAAAPAAAPVAARPAADHPPVEAASETVRRSAVGSPAQQTPAADQPVASRRRRVAVLLTVGVIAVAAVGTAAWALGPGDDPAGRAEDRTTTSAPPFTPVTIPAVEQRMKGVSSVRTYRITADRVSSSVVLENTTDKALTVLWTEVVPKELADHVGQVHFEPANRQVLEADPIVFWRLELGPGASRTVRWSTPSPEGATASSDYLAQVTGWHEEAVTKARPLIRNRLPRYALPGDVALTPDIPDAVIPKDEPSDRSTDTESADVGVTAAPDDDVTVEPTQPPATSAPTRQPEPVNHAPRISLSSKSTSEQQSGAVTINASDPDGDSWSIVGVSGAPSGVGKTGAHTLGGTVSYRAADVTRNDSNIQSRSFTVTVTVEDSHGARANDSFTWTVRDTHLAMPNYIGTGGGPTIPAYFNQAFDDCLDLDRPVDTVAKQSTRAGAVVAYGSRQVFTYVYHDGSHPPC